jgi:hypothetical protein
LRGHAGRSRRSPFPNTLGRSAGTRLTSPPDGIPSSRSRLPQRGNATDVPATAFDGRECRQGVASPPVVRIPLLFCTGTAASSVGYRKVPAWV